MMQHLHPTQAMTSVSVPQYDVVIVGTGFASTFFLREYLRRAPPSARVLVLERGERLTHTQQLRQHGRLSKEAVGSIRPNAGSKPWTFRLGFGGSSNCWWGNVPRMTPADFQLKSRFGVGADWPLSYADLEPYYCDAEEAMQVSGPDEHLICPRSRPCPQPPHDLSAPDRLFQRAYPDQFFAMPCARPRVATTGGRPACCGNGVCNTCPIDSKFTIQNEMGAVYADPRVSLLLGARADQVEVSNRIATGVSYQIDGRDAAARGELVVLGANGIFNPHLLLRSGFSDAELGRGLVEQVALFVTVYLDGVDNFGGSSARCGHGYMLHHDAGRDRRAAALVLTHNTLDVTGLRMRRGRWRQILGLTITLEDLRQRENRVAVDPADPTRPVTYHAGHSPYTESALAELPGAVERMLAPLPVEGFSLRGLWESGAHIIGTTVMGTDPAHSVVDQDLLHHTVRNLVVLGSGAFPTAAPANPTLTLVALTLRSADRILPRPRGARIA